MKPELSIIMPVYNGEKTVSVAIDSVISQTIKEIEIIIVNDGSKDASAEIIESYAKADPRIVYINKEKNEGLSAARNSGLEVAKGEYFTFVDADDWIDADSYERLLRNADGADVVVSGFYHDTLDDSGEVSVSVEDATGETVSIVGRQNILDTIAALDRKRLYAYTCNKLYKKEFIESLGIKFKNQTLIEDYQYNCYVFDKVTKISLVDGCFYHYIKFSTEALTRKYLPDYFEIMDKRYVLMRELFQKHGAFDGENRATVCSMHIKHIFSGMIKNCSDRSPLSPKEQRAVIKNLFKDANCNEAIKFAKSRRKQEMICNAVFSSKIVFLNYLVAKLLYIMQNSESNIFDKLK